MNRKKWPLWLGIALLLLVGAVLFHLTRIGYFDSRTLPPLNEIDAMQAAAYIGGDERHVRFPVPREKWPEILDALTPAEKDDHPAKWQTMGELLIAKHSGRWIIVELFLLPEQPGAFCIKTISGRTYCRGGDSAKLRAAVEAAYEASGEH